MEVLFFKKFLKDLDNINQKKDKDAIHEKIELVREVDSINEIQGLKKLKGFDDAYGIRCGDLRIGIFVQGDLVEFARVAFRKDIYKIFP